MRTIRLWIVLGVLAVAMALGVSLRGPAVSSAGGSHHAAAAAPVLAWDWGGKRW